MQIKVIFDPFFINSALDQIYVVVKKKSVPYPITIEAMQFYLFLQTINAPLDKKKKTASNQVYLSRKSHGDNRESQLQIQATEKLNISEVHTRKVTKPCFYNRKTSYFYPY